MWGNFGFAQHRDFGNLSAEILWVPDVISLVLPTYNPGEKIDTTWHAVCAFLATRRDEWEVLFVLDGCTDDTATRLDRLRNDGDDDRIRVLGYPQNRGKGHAVRFGLTQGRGRIRAFTDVDLAYDFDDVVRVCAAVDDTQPFCIACRSHPESLLLIPDRLLGYAYRRKAQSLAFRTATRLLTGLHYQDTQAGLKAMTAELVDHIAPHTTIDGFGFDCDWLLAAKLAGVTATELPIRVRYEEGTTTSSLTGVKMLRELAAIRRAWKKKSIGPYIAASPQAAIVAAAA